MYSYNLAQWFLFFYIYCFLGWIWESCFVSVKQKKWANRGFMHGPFLPIYGSGAIIVLLSTLPVKGNIGLVFICGMIGATLLEYVTGMMMEVLFHVRYWDYSKEPFNIKGHICLKASIAWGGFSVLMIYVLHEPIEAVVFMMNRLTVEVIALGLSIIVMVDLIESFKEAMDLKEMLMHLSQSNVEIQLIRKKLDVTIAIIDSDASKLKEKLLQSKRAIEDRLLEEKQHYEEALREQFEKSQEKAVQGRALLESGMEKINKGKTLALQALSEKANTYLEQIEEYTKEKGIVPSKELDVLKAELEEV